VEVSNLRQRQRQLDFLGIDGTEMECLIRLTYTRVAGTTVLTSQKTIEGEIDFRER
jgi:hypothetical protein